MRYFYKNNLLQHLKSVPKAYDAILKSGSAQPSKRYLFPSFSIEDKKSEQKSSSTDTLIYSAFMHHAQAENPQF